MPAVQQLSGTIVVIIIAVGVQACIILFIFAKRQIQRFALRNRRGPHMSIGHGGPKSLRREADKLLDYVQYIKHEPILEALPPDSRDYRRLLIINFQSFEYDLASYSQYYIRPPCSNVRAHLVSCASGPLVGVDIRLIQQVCDDYYNARHHYEDIDIHKYQAFLKRLASLRACLQTNKLVKPHPSPLPPPAQTFSNSPRKRRGRGGTSFSVTSVGGATTNLSNSNTKTYSGHSSRVVGFNVVEDDRTQLSTGHASSAMENYSYSPESTASANANFQSNDSEEAVVSRHSVPKVPSATSRGQPNAALSSLVTVENNENRKTDGNIVTTVAV